MAGERSKSAIYRPLPLPTPRSIRLLTILPGKRSDIVQCTLRVVDLEDDPPYEALSYVWGNPDPPSRILCNGKSFRVTPNLGAALQHLRYADASKARILWIDAICINQADLDERSQQVSFMKEVYGLARSVTVWLGEDDGTASSAISIIQKAAQHCWNEVGFHYRLRGIISAEAPNSALKLQRDLPHPRHQDWAAVTAFYRRDWFTRIWVPQEVAQDERATMLIGDLTVAWYDVTRAAKWIIMKKYATDVEITRSLANAVYIHRCGNPSSLLQMLRATCRFNASDPRDKVYAIVGSSAQALESDQNSLPRPDYNKTVVEVYSDVVHYFISNPRWMGEGGLDILAKNEYLEDASHVDFPSWVPRWDLSLAMSWPLSDTRLRLKLSAGGDSAIKIGRTNSPTSLVLRGLRMTTIKTLPIVMDLALFGMDKPLHLLLQDLLERTADGLSPYAGPDTLETAFACTITAGKSRNEDSLEAFNEADLAAYLREGSQSDAGNQFYDAIHKRWWLFTTDNGHIGLCQHRHVRVGDEVCVLFGGKTPHIIRPVDDHFTFLGECYVHGFMNGEAIDLWKQGKYTDQWIDMR